MRANVAVRPWLAVVPLCRGLEEAAGGVRTRLGGALGLAGTKRLVGRWYGAYGWAARRALAVLTGGGRLEGLQT